MSSKDELWSNEPIYHPQSSWLENLNFSAWTAVKKTVVHTFAYWANYRGNAPDPARIVSYSSHPTLKNRIHLPPGYAAGDKPPLLLEIHGGGFMLFDPSYDDSTCATFANRMKCMVISLDYSKSPAAKFPVAVNEIVDTVVDIFNDESISFDKSRVACCGYSAGATLTLSIAQSPKLQGKIHGVIPFFPITEFITDVSERALSRPYDSPDEVDMLFSAIPGTKHAYIAPGQNIKDPVLSPHFADRSTLPKWILMIGAEHDLLCREAWWTTLKYAGLEPGKSWEEGMPQGYEFEDGKLEWYLAKGAKHGYTHFMGAKGEAEEKRLKQAADCYEEVYKWLEAGPFALGN